MTTEITKVNLIEILMNRMLNLNQLKIKYYGKYSGTYLFKVWTVMSMQTTLLY